MSRNQRVIKSRVHKGLSDILKASKQIAKSWGLQSIPLVTLKEIIEKGKIDENSSENKEVKKFYSSYNKMLTVIYQTCEKKAIQMKSDHVAIAYIRICINHTKKTFESSVSSK